jgi:hypothetical protein
MPPTRRTPKPPAQAKPSSRKDETAKGEGVDLPPMTEQRGEGPDNLKARSDYFLKRRGQP